MYAATAYLPETLAATATDRTSDLRRVILTLTDPSVGVYQGGITFHIRHAADAQALMVAATKAYIALLAMESEQAEAA